MPDGYTKSLPRHRQGWLGRDLDRDALYWDLTPAHLAAIDELMARIEAINQELAAAYERWDVLDSVASK